MKASTKEKTPRQLATEFFVSWRIRKLQMMVLDTINNHPGQTILGVAHRMKWRAWDFDRMAMAVARLKKAKLIRQAEDGKLDASDVPKYIVAEIARRKQTWETEAVSIQPLESTTKGKHMSKQENEECWRSIRSRMKVKCAGNGGARINTVLFILVCGHMKRYPGSAAPRSQTLRCEECEAKAQADAMLEVRKGRAEA